MEQRKADLRAGKGNFLTPLSNEEIETMVESIDEAIILLKQT